MTIKKGLALISSGIDSPVAAYLMMKKGLDVDFVHFITHPDKFQTSIDKVKRQIGHLSKMFDKELTLYIVDHRNNLAEFGANANPRYGCVFCKRTMLRVAERLAILKGYDSLVTGENLGQVASQTLDNMAEISNSVKLPIFRPLLTNDKQETINLAKEIGTLDTSIEKDACCYYLPTGPVTKARRHIIENDEHRVNVGLLIDNSLKNYEVVVIKG